MKKKEITIGEAIDMLVKDEDLKFSSGGVELYKHAHYGIVVLDVYKKELYPALSSPYVSNCWSECQVQ